MRGDERYTSWGERYKSWVALVRSRELSQVRQAVNEMEDRLRAVGLSGGEQRLLSRARALLDERSPS